MHEHWLYNTFIDKWNKCRNSLENIKTIYDKEGISNLWQREDYSTSDTDYLIKGIILGPHIKINYR